MSNGSKTSIQTHTVTQCSEMEVQITRADTECAQALLDLARSFSWQQNTNSIEVVVFLLFKNVFVYVSTIFLPIFMNQRTNPTSAYGFFFKVYFLLKRF